MPVDHGKATLQFDKEYEGVQHGTELHCSDPSCKKDGTKYLYCKNCDEAAAKNKLSQEAFTR